MTDGLSEVVAASIGRFGNLGTAELVFEYSGNYNPAKDGNFDFYLVSELNRELGGGRDVGEFPNLQVPGELNLVRDVDTAGMTPESR